MPRKEERNTRVETILYGLHLSIVTTRIIAETVHIATSRKWARRTFEYSFQRLSYSRMPTHAKSKELWQLPPLHVH